MSIQPFHLAIPVNDLDAARSFYGGMMGCEQGRSSAQWIDWDFFGHQLVTHLVEEIPSQPSYKQVDCKAVPVPHFGVVLTWQDWQSLSVKLTAANSSFVVEPCIRFTGQIGEQATMFLRDPAGNALEFKAFKDISQLFSK